MEPQVSLARISGLSHKFNKHTKLLHIFIHTVNFLIYGSCSSLVVSKHGLYAGGLGSIPTAVTTRTAAGGDAEHVSLNH